MVVSGPIPGSTPMAVPMTQPKKQRPMFCQVSAMPKPMTMLDRTSDMSGQRRPERNDDPQRDHKDSDIGGNQD